KIGSIISIGGLPTTNIIEPFFSTQNRLHNIHRGVTHYKYYRALFFYNKIGSIISIVDLPTTNIIESFLHLS
ncbi:TPA: hypothetical protein V1059_11000, partial [Streptococcus pneumoniae]|nr:hypothetical protein [Streptococcus pneumoniae]